MNKKKLVAIVAMSAGFLSVHIMLSDTASPSAGQQAEASSGYTEYKAAPALSVPYPLPDDDAYAGYDNTLPYSGNVYDTYSADTSPDSIADSNSFSFYGIPDNTTPDSSMDTSWQYKGTMFEEKKTWEESYWDPSPMQTDTSWQYEGSMFEQ